MSIHELAYRIGGNTSAEATPMAAAKKMMEKNIMALQQLPLFDLTQERSRKEVRP